MKKGEEGAKGLSGELGNMATGLATLVTMQQVAGLVGDHFKAVSQHITEVTTKFLDLQQKLVQVAALMGKTPGKEFTVDQAKQAEQAGLKPEEWVKFQEQFQSYGGAYLEDVKDAQGNVTQKAKISGDDATKYQQQLAAFAKARGIPADQIAQLGGGILQFSEGALTSDEAMAKLGKQYKTLERAPTPVGQLLPQMTRLMAQGASGDEAAQLLSLMSEAMPGEEGTGVENTLKALQHAILKGKGGELGVTKDMSPMERIKAASRTLADKQAAGEDTDAMIAEFFPDLREQRGIKGFINRGVTAGGFSRVAGYGAETPDDFTQTAIADYRKSGAGRDAAAEARVARAQVERGSMFGDVGTLRKNVEAQLEEQGGFEQFNPVNSAFGLFNRLGITGSDSKERLINMRTLEAARKEAGQDVDPLDPARALNRSTTDTEVRDLLKKIAENTGAAPPPKPLSAPPPQPVTRP